MTSEPHASEHQPTDPPMDASISMGMANLVGIVLLFPIGLLTLGPHWLLWGKASLGMGFQKAAYLPVFIPVFLANIVLHEALHGFGYRVFGGVGKLEVKFGINWKSLSPYAHCSAAMTAGAYRLSVMLPGIVLGVLPVLSGLASGMGWLTVWGFIMTVAAGGDIAILWAIRKIPSERLVMDHPKRAGCVVISETDP